MRAEDYKISSEKFTFHSTGENIHDTKLETKPVTYFRDALNRFAKNKASILAAFIIAILILLAIVGPIITPYQVNYADNYYRFVLPRNPLCYNLGIKFWDGGQNKEVNKATYEQFRAIQIETGREVIMNEPKITEQEYMGKKSELYKFRLDTYNAVGVKYILLDTAQYVVFLQVRRHVASNEVRG